METIEIKIRRIDVGGEELPLEMRVYEAVRKSELPCSQGEWNSRGREYSIKGLHNLMRTSSIRATFENSIEEDLKMYEEKRKR